MAKKKPISVGGIVLTGLTLLGVAYLAHGAGSKKNSALIPDVLEKEIDKIVDQLNATFPNGWVDLGLDVLTKFLASTLSPTGRLLLPLIAQVEHWAASQPPEVAGIGSPSRRVTGQQKRARAVALYQQQHGNRA